MTKTLDFKNIGEEIEFWESHDSTEYWDDMEEVKFDVDFHQNLLHPRLVFLTYQPDHCPRCHQNLENAMIQYVTWHNGHLMIIRDVAILRCQVNGHEYILEKTLDRIEKLLTLEKTQKLRPAEIISVPVFKLEAAV